MFIPLHLVKYPCKGLLSHVQEIIPKIPKKSKISFYRSRRSVCKHFINSIVLGWPGVDCLAVLPGLYYVCAFVDVLCATTYLLKMDVFDCPKSSCSFSAFTEHELATHVSMADNEKLVQEFNADDDKRTTTKKTRDVFNDIPRRLFGHTKRVRVDRSAFAQNDANFKESTLEVEENVSMEPLRCDEHVDDLNTLRESSEKDETFEFLCIRFIELKRYLPSSKLQ